MPRSSNFSPLRDVRWFSVYGGERKTDNGSPWALFKRPRAKLAERDAKGCRVPRGWTSPRHDPFSTCCSPLRRLGAPTRMPLTRTPPLWRHTVALACAWQCIRDTHTHKLEHACTPQDPCASYPHPPRFVWFLYRWLFSTNHPHPTFLPTLFPSFPPPPSPLSPPLFSSSFPLFFPFLFLSWRLPTPRPTFVFFFFFLFQFQDSFRIVRQLLRMWYLIYPGIILSVSKNWQIKGNLLNTGNVINNHRSRKRVEQSIDLVSNPVYGNCSKFLPPRR